MAGSHVRRDFDERVAAEWLGMPEAGGPSADIDRADWFAWRGPEEATVQRVAFPHLVHDGVFLDIIDGNGRNGLMKIRIELLSLRLEGFQSETR